MGHSPNTYYSPSYKTVPIPVGTGPVRPVPGGTGPARYMNRPGTWTGPVPTPKPCLQIRENGKPTGFTGKPPGFFLFVETGRRRFC
jgi:hypothetical protein